MCYAKIRSEISRPNTRREWKPQNKLRENSEQFETHTFSNSEKSNTLWLVTRSLAFYVYSTYTHLSIICNFAQFLVDTLGKHWLPHRAFTCAWLIANPAMRTCSVNHCVSVWGFRPNLPIQILLTAELFTNLKKNTKKSPSLLMC